MLPLIWLPGPLIFQPLRDITPEARVIGLFAGALAVFLLDHWSKRMVEARLANGQVALAGIVCIRHMSSRRARYNSDSMRVTLVVIWVAALVSAVVLVRLGTYLLTDAAILGLGAALGGAAGNLFEILGRRGVTDFIDPGWWPAFNLADVAIVVGLTMTMWTVG